MRGVRNPVTSVPPAAVEGPPRPNEPPPEYVRRLAREKCEALLRRDDDAVVLAADTIVVADGRPLGKPESVAETQAMLAQLRGRVHQVLTGVSVYNGSTTAPITEVTRSDVEMRDYSCAEAQAYARAGAGLDKAGGYGIQDRQFRPARRVDGCYLNVVGLPLCTVVKLLSMIGAIVELQPRVNVPYAEECRDCGLRWPPEEQP